MTNDIPPQCVTRPYRGIKLLEKDAAAVLVTLERNNFSGNQFILVLGLTKPAIQHLAYADTIFDGIEARFEWEGSTALIKVVPGNTHERTTSNLTWILGEALGRMGVPLPERQWGLATTHVPTVGNKGRQGDQTFLPPSRQRTHGEPLAWPTLVVETGVSELLPKLRQDVKWWFDNSQGQVRIVIMSTVRNT